MIRIEMLSTGDEVLHGQIVDTNAAWLAEFLFDHGMALMRRTTVGDHLAELVSVLQERSQQADVLIVNGGLGPTSDDMTALAAANAADVALVENTAWTIRMLDYFTQRGLEMPKSNLKQAYLPAGAEFIDNPVGTACGFMMRLNRCLIFFTPGVPHEFNQMVRQKIVPYLQQHFPTYQPLHCLRMTTFGCAESQLASQLESMAFPDDVMLGYRSAAPIIELKLTGPQQRQLEMAELWRKMREKVADHLLFEGTEGMAHRVAQSLKHYDASLAISEQFTAGLLTYDLQNANTTLAGTEFPQIKTAQTLAQIVSMAQVVAERTGSHYGLAISQRQGDEIIVAIYSSGKSMSAEGQNRFQGAVAQRFRLLGYQTKNKIAQQLFVLVAQDMLMRVLEKRKLLQQHRILELLEQCDQR